MACVRRPRGAPPYDGAVNRDAGAFDRELVWRAALLQAATVGALFVLLAVLLPRSFFREHGAVTGPLAWIACALLTGRVLGLGLVRVLAAAAAAGILAAAVGAVAGHLAGLVVAVPTFGALCAVRGVRRTTPLAGRLGARS